MSVEDINRQISKELVGMMQITDGEFDNIRKLVYKHFGINLTEQKKNLVVGRLQKLVKQLGFATFHEYYEYVLDNQQALSELVNRISTNHTFFFRESEHFDFFKSVVLPEISQNHKAANDYDLRIWCAAASSGEEPYTLMMTMLDYFGSAYSKWDAGLLATDISEKALKSALGGVYPDERVQLVPDIFKSRYMTQVGSGLWKVNDDIINEVTFRRFNLMNDRFPFKKQFDAIFCRNVMIYFDQTTRDRLVNKLFDITKPGGYLFIGHSETLGRDKTPWRYIKPAVYRKEV